MVRVIAVEGVPRVGKTSCIYALNRALTSRGITSTIVPEVIIPLPNPPVPSSHFVQNDRKKWERAKLAKTDIVLMDRTWVSTNSCASVLRQREHITQQTSDEFRVEGCIFVSLAHSPWADTPADWPWTLPRFLADWERQALRDLPRLTEHVLFWRGNLRVAEDFLLHIRGNGE